MNYLSYVMAFFSLLGAIDLIIGNKLGLGKEFEKGMHLIGTMMLSMVGMLLLAPCIAVLLKQIIGVLPDFIDPSILPASFLANDMGGAPLAVELCRTDEIGAYNSMVVSSMMGCTISFNIPFAIGMIPKEYHDDTLMGFLCGIVTIPTGCIIGGLIAGLSFSALVVDLIPLLFFSILIVIGLLKWKRICLKIMSVFAGVIKILLIAGLAAGIFRLLTGITLIPYMDPLESAVGVVLKAACVLSGTFPLIAILMKVMKKPLGWLGKQLNINELATLGIISTLATNVTAFSIMKEMDRRGRIMNAAFAVSASFVFGSHLAFTMSFLPEYTFSVIAAKLVSGVTALVFAWGLCRKYS